MPSCSPPRSQWARTRWRIVGRSKAEVRSAIASSAQYTGPRPLRADVARERKEYDNVTFFNDFTPNITAGLAARIATLSTDRLRYHHNWIHIFRILGLR